MNTPNNQKIKTKNLVTIGIFSALMFAMSMIAGIVTGSLPILYLFAPVLFGLTTGAFFMITVAKVNSFGAILIPSMIIGILWTLMGGYTMLIGMGVLGIIGELLAFKSKYQNFKVILLGYILFVLGYFFGALGPIYIMTESYIEMSLDGGFDETHIYAVVDAAKSWIIIISLLGTIVASIVGGYIGKKVLRKHFEKAGIV